MSILKILGEKCDVSIHIRVDKKTAGPLTSGQDQLYEILVLHLVGGKDIFITVSGEYQRSSFGASIDALVRMTVPICELSTSAILQLEGTTTGKVFFLIRHFFNQEQKKTCEKSMAQMEFYSMLIKNWMKESRKFSLLRCRHTQSVDF